MSVILITGSCGLVGSESSKFFCEKGFDVVGIDNINSYYDKNFVDSLLHLIKNKKIKGRIL